MSDDDIAQSEPDEPERIDDPAEEPANPNAASTRGTKRQRDKAQRDAEEEAGFWRSVLDNPVGRRVLWQFIVGDCGAFQPPFKVGPNGFPQPDATWFSAGKRAAGEVLYQRLFVLARDGVLTMHDEHDTRFIKSKKRQ